MYKVTFPIFWDDLKTPFLRRLGEVKNENIRDRVVAYMDVYYNNENEIIEVGYEKRDMETNI